VSNRPDRLFASVKERHGQVDVLFADAGAGSSRPRGSFMSGEIESGQLCTVAPADPETLRAGDIVLCKVNGREYLHLIKANQGHRFQIGNNRGLINGWVTANAIFGKYVSVEV